MPHPTPYNECAGVPAGRKWEAIFRQTCQALELPPNSSSWTTDDAQRAWNQIAVAVNQSHQGRTNSLEVGGQVRSKFQMQHRRQGSSVSAKSVKSDRSAPAPAPEVPDEVLLRIPDYGRGQLIPEEFTKIDTYLQKVMNEQCFQILLPRTFLIYLLGSRVKFSSAGTDDGPAWRRL